MYGGLQVGGEREKLAELIKWLWLIHLSLLARIHHAMSDEAAVSHAEAAVLSSSCGACCSAPLVLDGSSRWLSG